MTNQKEGPDAWLIRKGAYFYRPNCQGYTTVKAEAGRYTEAKAKSEASVEPWHMSALLADDVPGPAMPWLSFQARVQPWMMACFGPEISGDKLERGDWLLEEMLELLQSVDYPRERIASLSSYVWSRPKGEPAQEVGGGMVTFAAFCLAHDLDMHAAGEAELARIWTKVDAIRAKQAAKPTGSALPIAITPAPAADCAWSEGKTFGFHDDPGEHAPCYVIMPDGGMLVFNHHAGEGVDIARALFVQSACNAALAQDGSEPRGCPTPGACSCPSAPAPGDDAPHGWVCWNEGPGGWFWFPTREQCEHELSDDIRPATAAEKALFGALGGKFCPDDQCPVCLAPLKPDDICATDVDIGTCHAACLEDSPTVDLETGEPFDGDIPTFRYGDEPVPRQAGKPIDKAGRDTP